MKQTGRHRPARRSLLKAGAALGLTAPVLAACASKPVNRIPPPRSFIPPPSPQSGERWRYAIIDRFSGETTNEVTATVARVSPNTVVELVDRNGRKLADERYASPWQVEQEPTYNETLVFEQPLPLIPKNLAVGYQETLETRFTLSGSDNPHAWLVTTSVRGWERLTVPAGEFDAVRIDHEISFESPDLFRRGSRRTDTLWYAPKVNRWVKRQWTGSYFEDGPDPFGFFDWHGPYRHDYSLRHNQSMLRGNLMREFVQRESEDNMLWVLLEHQAAPVA